MILPGEIDLGCPVNFDSPLTDRLAAFWTGIPGLDALPAVPDAALRYPAAVTASPISARSGDCSGARAICAATL